MKTAYYTANQINSQNVGEAIPLGLLPLSFRSRSGVNLPSFFSVIDSDDDVANILTGKSPIESSSTTVSVNVLTGQSIDVVITRGTNWGSVTLSPTQSFISIVSVVDDVLTLRIDATVGGSGGDYLQADYNSNDYLTTGINALTGCYTIDILNDAVSAGTLNVCIYPASQISIACPEDVINFAWVNEDGGWSSMALDCRFVNGITQGRQSSFLTSGNVKKIFKKEDVFETINVSANIISKIELDALASLRQSIQAYIYNNVTEQFDIPVFIDASSFQTYGNKFRQGETDVSFTFEKATKKTIQNQ